MLYVNTCSLPSYKFFTLLTWRDVYDSKVFATLVACQPPVRPAAPALRPPLHLGRPGRPAPTLPGPLLRTPLVPARHALVSGLATPPGRRHHGSRRAGSPSRRGRCLGAPLHPAFPGDPFPGHHRLQRRPPALAAGLGGRRAGRPWPASFSSPSRASTGTDWRCACWMVRPCACAHWGIFPRSSAGMATSTSEVIGA